MKIFALILSITFLAALGSCDEKKDQGLHTGTALVDCPAIKENQREDAARAIKGINDKDAAAKALAAKFGISEADAKACLA